VNDRARVERASGFERRVVRANGFDDLGRQAPEAKEICANLGVSHSEPCALAFLGRRVVRASEVGIGSLLSRKPRNEREPADVV